VPSNTPNEEAALEAASVVSQFNWRLFRAHFYLYEVMVVAAGVVRSFIERSFNEWTIPAVVLIYTPIAAIGALFAMRQKPHVEGAQEPKPRVLRAICIGLAICLATIGIGWVLTRV
jgi:hypothetical protein